MTELNRRTFKEIIRNGGTLFIAEAIIRHGHNLEVSDEALRAHFGTRGQIFYEWHLELLVVHGKLVQDEAGDWSNVLAHCGIQYAAVKEVVDALGRYFCGASYPSRSGTNGFHSLARLAKRAALIHDWDKRRQIKRDNFTDEELATGDEVYEGITNLDTRKLIAATGPDFLERVLQGKASIWELIQFYVDDICKGGEIVPLLKRIAEVEARRQDLNDDTELTKRLGGRKYWDAEREIGRMAERLIFFTLGGVENLGISSPEELPNWIRANVEERIRESVR